MPNYRDDTVDSAVLNDDTWLKVRGAPAVESAYLDDVVVVSVSTRTSDAAVLNDGYRERRLSSAVDAGVLNDAYRAASTLQNKIVDAPVLNDAYALRTHKNPFGEVDGGVLNDASAAHKVSTNVVEAGLLSDAGDYRQDWSTRASDSAILGDGYQSVMRNLVAETGVLNDAVPALTRRANRVLESAVLNDAIRSGGITKVTLAADAGMLNDATLQSLSGVNLVFDIGYLNDASRGGAGVAWSAPTDTMAMSRFTEFSFSEMAVVDGVLVGINDSGAFILEGPDDGGVDIDAVITHDWTDNIEGRDGPEPSPDLKRPRYVYLAGKFDGVVAFVLGYVDDGARVEQRYELPVATSVGVINNRAPLGRGIRSRQLRAQIFNVDGANFELDGGRIVVDVLERSL